jgi:hypothetical protein
LEQEHKLTIGTVAPVLFACYIWYCGCNPADVCPRRRLIGGFTSHNRHVGARLLLILGLILLVSNVFAQKRNTKSPHGPLAIPCENCHTTAAWRPIRAVPEFNHDKTNYPLRGMHKKVECTECHLKPVFTDVGKNCADCHADIHRRKFGADCAQCQTVLGWQVSVTQIKDHQNRFPLFGAHAAVQCEDCHKSAAVGQFQGLSTACSSCHLTDYQKTTNPNHATSKFPTTCETCHSFDSWLGARFDHSTTGFLLTNGHANVPCTSCHINNNYNLQIAPTDCGHSGCHLTTWQQTNNPVHSTAGPAFALANCANCHTTAGWDTASFDHSVTGFTLVGTHMSPTPTACTACHISNNYTLNSTDCYGCHQSAWNSTATIGGNVPNHIAVGFPNTAAQCASCHPITTWSAGKFDHSTTGFLLTNGHANVPCTSCHIKSNYNLQIAPTDCGNSGCHLTTWQQTNNPVHSTAGPAFAVGNCANCHTTKGWDAASFDHSVTGFTLVGTHMSPTPTPCTSCHISNDYTLNSTDCYGCHQSVWNSTATIGGSVPNHIAVGFPNTAAQCASCHPITTWAAGMFDHSTTGFPLTGAHADPTKAPCSACHVNNNYSGNLPTDCYSCHIAAWQSTVTLGGSIPNHVAAGFPTNCATAGCHNTTSWLGATFNHNNFWQLPHHAAVCSDCHIDQSNYANMSCINCHTQPAHDKTSTDSHHQGRAGYKYGPMTCIAAGCHPKGSGGG